MGIVYDRDTAVTTAAVTAAAVTAVAASLVFIWGVEGSNWRARPGWRGCCEGAYLRGAMEYRAVQ